MSSPYSTVATALQQIINTEFAPEGFVAIKDRIHESLGRERTEIGIAPIEEFPREGNAITQETSVEIRFYDVWSDEIDPSTMIDPTRITGYAERLRSAIRRSQASDPATGSVWFFQVGRTQYPEDPTGNNTRFHMNVRALGNNSALVETVA